MLGAQRIIVQTRNDLLAPNWLSPDARAVIFESVANAYPEEACGVLLGPASTGVVTRVAPCRNVFAGDRCHGYALDPIEHLRILRCARQQNETQLAIFHSHPNGEAMLSHADLLDMWLAGRPKFPDVLFCVVDTKGALPQRIRAFASTSSGQAQLRGEWEL